MKEIEIEIKGPRLLMNSPHMMLEDSDAVVSKTKRRDPKVEAEKVVYRMKSGELYIPNTAIKGAILNASKAKKTRKYALKPFIASGLRIDPEQIGLGTKVYEIDRRTVVIQRERVVKCRPILRNWRAKFTVVYDNEMLPEGPDIIIPLLEEAGQRIGILDFRPEKGGEFGTFEVTKWVAKKGGKK